MFCKTSRNCGSSEVNVRGQGIATHCPHIAAFKFASRICGTFNFFENFVFCQRCWKSPKSLLAITWVLWMLGWCGLFGVVRQILDESHAMIYSFRWVGVTTALSQTSCKCGSLNRNRPISKIKGDSYMSTVVSAW